MRWREGTTIRDGRRLPPSPPLDRSDSRMAGLRAREWTLGDPGRRLPIRRVRVCDSGSVPVHARLPLRGQRWDCTRLPVSSRATAAARQGAAGHRPRQGRQLTLQTSPRQPAPPHGSGSGPMPLQMNSTLPGEACPNEFGPTGKPVRMNSGLRGRVRTNADGGASRRFGFSRTYAGVRMNADQRVHVPKNP